MCFFFLVLTQRRQRERHMGEEREGGKNPACKRVRGIVWGVIIPPHCCYCIVTVQCRVRGQGERLNAPSRLLLLLLLVLLCHLSELTGQLGSFYTGHSVSAKRGILGSSHSPRTRAPFFFDPPKPSSLVASRLASLIILSAAIQRHVPAKQNQLFLSIRSLLSAGCLAVP